MNDPYLITIPRIDNETIYREENSLLLKKELKLCQ